jgi:integrase/recombinase XerC
MDTPPPFEKSLNSEACRLVEACVKHPSYHRKLRRFFFWVAHKEDRRVDLERLKTFGQDDLEAYAKATSLSSNNAFNHLISGLRVLGRVAHKDQKVLLPGLFRLKTRKGTEHAHPILAQDQVRALVMWPDEPDFSTSARSSAMFALCYGLGVRPGQMILLNREDYQSGADARIRVTWRHKSRELPVLPAVARLIDRYLDDWDYALGPKDPLFPNEDGTRLKRNSFDRELNRRAAALGIPFTIGALELTEAFKAHMLAAGAHHAVIKKIMGFTSIDSADLIGRRVNGSKNADEM